jgi:integrase
VRSSLKLKGTSVASAERPYPKGVWFQPKILVGTGERVFYGYLGRGPGMIALGRKGTPEFFARLSEALSSEPASGTVKHLLWRYRREALPKLRERTQADYRLRLDLIEKQFGALSLRAMASTHIGKHIVAWRDEVADSPRQADYRIQVLSAFLGWAVKQRLLASNQALNIERLHSGDRRERVWTPEQEAAFLAVAPEPMRRALILAIETGQRQADLLALTWGAVKGGVIRLRQSKTRVDVAVDISEPLRLCLAAAPRGDAVTILTTERGAPWEPKGNGFRAAWRDTCKRAGIAGVTFHDLRGTFASRRMAEGWSAEDVALCTGHSLRDLATLEKYICRANVAGARAEARAVARAHRTTETEK